MNATFQAALIRGLIGGIISGGGIFFGALAVNPGNYWGAFILAMGSLFGYLATRSVAEGWFDTNNDLQRQTDNAKYRGLEPPVVITETSVTPVTPAAAEIAKESESDAGEPGPVSPGDGV